MKYLLDLIKKHKSGEDVGIYSACSSQAYVIEAVLLQGLKDNNHVLIESTSNQVDQYGGYTGMKPVDFVSMVFDIAERVNFNKEKIIFGGDHLGPNAWQHLNAEEAMSRAKILIEEYVKAGYKKIHLDCSMACGDDPINLDEATKAKRAAMLCEVAEKTAIDRFGQSDIVYVIGTEVPVPGGETEEISTIEVTSTDSANVTINYHVEEFSVRQLKDVWPRVIGLVVQPGVEFDHHNVVHYERRSAKMLKQFIELQPTLLFEAHSTDYQKPETYKQLVEDHFAILKVGPALTFALREALFSLSLIEDLLLNEKDRSNLNETVIHSMKNNPNHWSKYYSSENPQKSIDMIFSLSDRIRYYWSERVVTEAIERMISNLTKTPIPLTMLSHFLPNQHKAIVSGEIENKPREIILNKIMEVTEVYNSACLSR